MKHLFAALAICAATSTPFSEATPLVIASPSEPVTVFKPDFSIIEIDHARNYVKKIYPLALRVSQEQGIPIPITLAIACLESGYGRSYNAKKKNNHLGIRVYQNGKAGYRRFSSTEDCFEYYSNMFNMERYQPLQEIKSDDLKPWVEGLQVCGFNHRDKYKRKLLQMVNFLHLDEIDYFIA